MLAADPPEHTRLRKLVAAAFTPRRVAALSPRIEQTTEELLDRIANRDQVDLMDAIAVPLPTQVICELLGVPAADQDDFRSWTRTIIAGVATGEAAGASKMLISYLLELIGRKRVEPGEDIISALIAAQDDGDQLTAEELSSTVLLLLIAGHETTVNLIGNGAYLLLTHPQQRDALRADPALLPGAIEEFLRYESPLQTATFRIAVAATRIGGQDIGVGEPVLVSLLSANRDETRFADGARLDVTRRDNPHLAFGHGIHYCLGAPLARIEGQVALGKLIAAYPDMTLTADDLEWRMSTLMHGLMVLPVRPGRRAPYDCARI
jgi:cytochrome P450